MQAILSFEQTPAFSVPFRFFLTAPLFLAIAGALLTWQGPDALISRWQPSVLAVTHLITVGFMLQIMLGALFQILPVIAGANMRHPLLTSRLSHSSTVCAALLLAWGFLSGDGTGFILAILLFTLGLGSFLQAAFHALAGVPGINATLRGLRLALFGLIITVILGFSLAFSFSGFSEGLNLPLSDLTDLHLSWGLAGWGLILIAAIADVVVPMFQLTSTLPRFVSRFFDRTVLALLSICTAALFFGWTTALSAGYLILIAGSLAFLVVLFKTLRTTKRAILDTTQRYWRFGTGSAVLALLFLAASRIPAPISLPLARLEESLPLCAGILLIVGGFVSVIIGMLYKIIPFLIWLHLQNQAKNNNKKHIPPNMKKILPEPPMKRQMQLHFLTVAVLLLAVFWTPLVRAAGLCLIADALLLMGNLLSALNIYRKQSQQISALPG